MNLDTAIRRKFLADEENLGGVFNPGLLVGIGLELLVFKEVGEVFFKNIEP